MKYLLITLLLVGLVLSLSAVDLVPNVGFDLEISHDYSEMSTGTCTVVDGVSFTGSSEGIDIEGGIIKCKEGKQVIYDQVNELGNALVLMGVNKEEGNVGGYKVIKFKSNREDMVSLYVMDVGDYVALVMCSSENPEQAIQVCEKAINNIAEKASSQEIEAEGSYEYEDYENNDYSSAFEDFKPSVCCLPVAIIGLALLSRR